jgi:cellulose synthase/poly-beta-1,6-N-acetylglucosamine synthase-like glycosyltransferase
MNFIIPYLYSCLHLVLFILAANVLYLLVFSVAAYFNKEKRPDTNGDCPAQRTLVMYPAYKEDEVIIDSVKSFREQDYPAENYRVVVLADSIREETLNEIKFMGAWVYRVPETNQRNKARAINNLLAHFQEDFDNCVVMDADNLVDKDFLKGVNAYFANGVKALQTRRVSKTNVSNLAHLDAYSEIINNHIFRKGQRALGFSSSLIGSGMAFSFGTFRENMKGMDVFSGFDKELELRLLENKIKIEYAPEIVVYDEKVSTHHVFVNQRRRWLYAQWYFLKKNTLKAIVLFGAGNFDYVNKVLQFVLLPRIICIGLAGMLLLLSPLAGTDVFVAALAINMGLATALVLPLKAQLKTGQILSSITEIPHAFANMLLALITAGKAAGKFLHTPHHSK